MEETGPPKRFKHMYHHKPPPDTFQDCTPRQSNSGHTYHCYVSVTHILWTRFSYYPPNGLSNYWLRQLPPLYLPQPFPVPLPRQFPQYSADPLITMQHTQYIGLSIHTPSTTTVKTANRKPVPWNSIKQDLHQAEPIPVAVRFMAWVCGRSIAGIAGSNTAGDMHACLLWVLCVVR